MPDIEHIPQVRFEGFTDTWEQRKFGEIATESHGGGTPKTSCREFWNGSIPWIQSSDLQEDNVENVCPRKKISKAGLHKSATQLVPANSIAIVTRVGVGKVALMSSEYATSQDFLSLSKLTIVPHFGVYAVYQKLQQEIQSVQGTSIKGMTKEYALSLSTNIPTKSTEQQKIGTFFRALDDLITLHQRKYDKLVNLKAAMLEKMFPKDGADVPEVRFHGFTDAWKQRKVGKFANVLSASRVHKGEWTTCGVPFFRSSDVVSSYKGQGNDKVFISQELFDRLSRTSGKPEKDDIFVTGGGSIGVPYIVPDDNPLYSKDADLIWIKKSERHNSRFLFAFLEAPYFREYISSISHIGTIAHYTIEQVKETPVSLPHFTEQKKIGAFFRSLDDLITLHKRKLEKLRNVKQACLEKMFVS